ncbi:UDP-3-O-(3-hydroxymyristoyl) glucosamine N-acyltransferase [Porphyromonas crevioricanis JCM 15906]|uniref:UDP-3-O-acylglucosamine N-acyltransferase n=1 Tax=Porphyromonas crevioricanis JCM 15906 TaxID=1305617 RepID=T1CN38_9PORP|nr:UDP-3-O-(3-hydroxymyristoyl) glucosamine N-acyltransferase [Porphyromonas crevioricanis JCM 15906]SJZ99719.1 UDP-3-O-[3-hydroxymyristoyl] glucosamine N-acyltransferase [Porphyromonas crevioricanis]
MKVEFTAGQIAGMLGGKVEGDPEVKLSDFCKIEEGKSGGLTFLANPKYEPYLYTCKASAVLVNQDFTPSQPLMRITLIRVPDAYAALASLMQLADAAMPKPEFGIDSLAFVHPSVELPEDCHVGAFAYVGRGSKIGKGCRIYPHAYVGEGVEVGAGSILYPHVVVYHGCRIGERCILHAGAVIGADGFGFAPQTDGYHKIPQLGIVEIADDVEVGANTCIDRAAMGSTKIEAGVKLDNLVQIAHNCSVGSHTVMAAQVGMAGSSHVGQWCQLGGQVGLSGHLKVGDKVSLGGQTGVLGDIPDNSVMLGSPAVPAREMLRSAALLRRLPDMYSRLDKLEKLLADKSKES